MGTWDELDIEYSVRNETSSLDEIISECNDSEFADIFAPAMEIAEKCKTAIDEGSKLGLQITADMTESRESRHISNPSEHPYAQGLLASSIVTQAIDEYTYIVGTSISHFYPLTVEYGREDAYPVNAKSLAWYSLTGELVFSKVSRGHNGYPYVEPTFDEMKNMIEGQGFGVFREVCANLDDVFSS